ncbi:beta-lactamase family protein [Hellea sp.]|nr:beta-lactamase family protein [Hellea sp.]
MRLALTLIAMCLIGCSAATSADSEDKNLPKFDAPKFDKAAMDSLLSRAVENGDVIGTSALVFDEGQTVYTGAFGLGDRERNTPVDMDTVWRIYSMTKPVTSVVIMDLIEEGKLKLSDPANKFIPELDYMLVARKGDNPRPPFEEQARPITIEDLMLHRSGMGYGIFGPINAVEGAYERAELFTPEETMETKMTKLTRLPLMFQPGDAWYYSYSIDVLGRIAEIIEGKSLGEIMAQRIFEPLGMTQTGFRVRPDQKPRFVSNYRLAEDGSFVLAEDGQDSPYSDPKNKFESGGGGLVSTLGDYAKFAQMMLDGGIYDGHRVLDEATVELMMQDHMGQDKPYLQPWLGPEFMSGFGYGGSVQIADTPEKLAMSGRSKGQWGWGGAAHTTFWIDRPNNAYGIIMLQFFSPENPKLHDDFRALAYQQTKGSK